MAVNSGVWYSGAVFFVALIRDFGWTYASTASILSLFSILAGGWGLAIGAAVDRLGTRRIVLAGGIVLTLALAASGLAQTRWHLYLTHSLLAALGVASIGWVPVSILLARRFAARRGLALGIASGGVGIGITVFVPVAQTMIDRLGWRLAFLGVGLLVGAVVLPLAWRLPDDAAVAREGGAGARPGERWSLLGAVRRPEFWGIAAAFILLNAPVQLAVTHQVAHLIETGLPRITAAGVVALMGLASIPGKIGWGFLSDRVRLEWTYAAGIAALVAGLGGYLALGPEAPGWLPSVAAVFLGVGYAVSPALTPVLTGRFFPGREFPAAFGALALIHNTAGAAGVWLAGYAHDLTGSYRLPLTVSMASALFAAAAVWLLAPRRIKGR
jgi:predicted MFS family arabinose efflux permease